MLVGLVVHEERVDEVLRAELGFAVVSADGRVLAVASRSLAQPASSEVARQAAAVVLVGLFIPSPSAAELKHGGVTFVAEVEALNVALVAQVHNVR